MQEHPPPYVRYIDPDTLLVVRCSYYCIVSTSEAIYYLPYCMQDHIYIINHTIRRGMLHIEYCSILRIHMRNVTHPYLPGYLGNKRLRICSDNQLAGLIHTKDA